MMGLIVVGNPIATVRTSSPSTSCRLCSFGLVKADRARRFALEPLLTKTAPRVPTNLYEARDLFGASEVARASFGDEVVDHYMNRARIELRAAEAAVTDFDLFRGFERL